MMVKLDALVLICSRWLFVEMMDKLVTALNKGKAEDEGKKDGREAELDKTEDSKKGLLQDEADLETAIDDAKESISTFQFEIEALMKVLGDRHDHIHRCHQCT